MKQIDYLIVGAGIAGAGLAYELAPCGSVLILDMEAQAGYHTTGRSAAFYAETYGGPLLQALTTASKDFLLRTPTAFADRPILTTLGAVHLFGDAQSDHAEAVFKEKSSQLPSVRKLSKEEVLAKVPYLLPDSVAGGIDDPDCGDLDVASLHQGFLKGAKRDGAQLWLNAAIEKASFENGLWHVETQAGPVVAKTLINAAGAWADDVARKCGVNPLGLKPLRRTIAVITSPAQVPFVKNGPVLFDIDEKFYFKPEGDGYLLSCADEAPSAPCDAQPEMEDVARAVDMFEQVSGASVTHVKTRWAGLRTFAPDRVPVIGYADDNPHFFWNAGQGGYGIQTAPAWSQLAASLVQRKDVPAPLKAHGVAAGPYDPARFS